MKKYSLFEVYGIESEYMIVDRKTLGIRPYAEKVLQVYSQGSIENEVERGDVAWSNELVSHVIEIKSNGPAKNLDDLHKAFVKTLEEIDAILKNYGAKLMPTSMHPFLNPSDGVELWPYGQKEIYESYDRIFNCKGHGWSNLQSVHINLPFANEDEFARLHAAMRIVLPLVPFISASSPIVENAKGEFPDMRLKFYEQNQKKVPEIVGEVIPEQIFSFSQYNDLYQSIYKAIAPYDDLGVLQNPWLNSRGVIPKFDVGALELRAMDIQECPQMDFTLIEVLVYLFKSLVNEEHMSFEEQKKVTTSWLKNQYDLSNRYDATLSENYAQILGLKKKAITAKSFFEQLRDKQGLGALTLQGLETFSQYGNLSNRIVHALEKGKTAEEIYFSLCGCLERNSPFIA